MRQLTRPFEEKADLTRCRVILIILIWFISIIIGFAKNYIRYYIINSEYYISLLRLITNIAGYYVPIMIILIFNFFIIKNLIIKSKKNNSNRRHFHNEKKAISCITSINFILILSHAFWFIVFPFEIFKFEFLSSLQKIYLSISYSYCALNPLVVFVFNKKIRKKFFLFRSFFQSYLQRFSQEDYLDTRV